MNRDARIRRPRTAALVALLLVVPAACTSSSSSTPPTNSTWRAALAYARCMRANGVPGFPDPDPNGRFVGVNRKYQGDPAFQTAQQKCRNRSSGGEHNPADPAYVPQLRKFARCMRNHGLPQFPDPNAGGGFPPGVEQLQGDPNFATALQACRAKLPGSLAQHGGG